MQGVTLEKIALKQLVIRTIQEYDSEGFDINATLRNILFTVLSNEKGGKGESRDTETPLESAEEIKQHLSIFMMSIAKSPAYWINLLDNEAITSRSTRIILNQNKYITSVYLQLLSEINHKIKTQHRSFQQIYLDSENRILLAQLINKIAEALVRAFQSATKFIEKEMNKVEQLLKETKVVTPYYLFALLKEVHHKACQEMNQMLSELMFRNVPPESTDKFCKYVIRNYEVTQLSVSEKFSPHIYEAQERRSRDEKVRQQWKQFLIKNEGLKLRRAKSIDGETGLFIQEKNEGKVNEQFILKIVDDRLQPVNCKITQKDWKIYNKQESLQKCLTLIEQNQAKHLLETDLMATVVPLQNVATVGGCLGQCLADINDYKSANDFLADLSKRAIVTSSLNMMFAEIPILGYFFVAGSFSYSFYNIYNNKVTDSSKKMKEFSRVSLTTVGAVGASITGAIVGQALIPVPVLGAFVGGVLGGYCGEKGTKVIAKKIDNSQFSSIIEYLLKHIRQNRYWKYDECLLKMLGISIKEFNRSNPFKQPCSDEWITAVAFCIVCFYESREKARFTEKKIKETEKSKKSIQTEDSDVEYKETFNVVEISQFLHKRKVHLIQVTPMLDQLTKPSLGNLS